MIEKSDGNGNLFMVPDPDYYNEDSFYRKIRRKPTNITPPKKKRRK